MTKKIEKSSFDYLTRHINRWIEANRNEGKEVEFVGSFHSLDPEDDFKFVDDITFAFGQKKSIMIDLSEMKEMIEKEKNGFINV